MTYFNPKKEDVKSQTSVATSNNIGVESAALITNDDPVSRAKELLALHHSATSGLSFVHTRELALECIDDILERWLPDGEQRGKQYVALNPTRDDSGLGSFSINIETGVWSDFAGDKKDTGGDPISLIAYIEGGISQLAAAVKILEFIAGLSSADSVAIVKRNAANKVAPPPEYTAIMPIPADARPCPVFFGSKLGHPAKKWAYRNADGQAMFYINRFNTETGKSFLPQTYCRDSTGWVSWQNKAPTAPRPAYGLDRLAARPNAPVLFNEGEKSADAAQLLFPGFVAVTTMNGAKSPEKTDFSPFAGRKVYFAPDNDDAGTAYTDKLIGLLRTVGAEVVAVLRLDMLVKDGRTLAQGYDLADAAADGWTAESLAELGEALWAQISLDDPTPPVPPPAPAKRPTRARKSNRLALPKKKEALELAVEFAMTNHGDHVAWFNNQMVAYKAGYWKPLNLDVSVKKPILEAIVASGDSKVSASDVNRIVELVKIKYAAMPEKFERNSPFICLNNGTLNPVTGELLPHSVDHYLTNKLNVTYDATLSCSLWLQTLDEIFSPDADKVGKIQLLQEYIGYCLIPDTRFHRFLWLVGAGGNGKSLILEMITALIGKVNISYAPIERLEEKFVRAELQGKLINMSSEMSARATVADGYLKQITAGDIIEAERKNEKPFSFKPYSRLIGATNALPRLLDHSDGFFRRAMIVRFNRQFKLEEQDKQRGVKLMAELPGILNWAVTGLQNLLQRGEFVMPQSSQDEVAQYRVNSDPVRQFAEEFLRPVEDSKRWVSSGALYESYKAWNNDNGYKALASNQFAERLGSIGFKKERDKNGRYWAAEYHDFGVPTCPPVPASSISPRAGNYKV
ncbi:Zn-finger [Collimonas arenae]|uniref:Zn-finger n=1 Tax=Collimonas arenae TaxID=279058 RepID=A0A0A1F5U4_9BURK|nr:phage/plasmid primase, P4 family [Collimonas arenae]AIY39886.1 Zn-finger [Collimonas arenae]